MALLQAPQRLLQIVDRNVHGHIGRWLNQREQTRRLGTATGSQLDQHTARRHAARHSRPVVTENRGLGSGEVVLGQLGDGVEQARTQYVVEELWRNLRCGRPQT